MVTIQKSIAWVLFPRDQHKPFCAGTNVQNPIRYQFHWRIHCGIVPEADGLRIEERLDREALHAFEQQNEGANQRH